MIFVVCLAVRVGPTYDPIININLLFALSCVFSLVIVTCTKDINAYMFQLVGSIYHVMLFLMSHVFLLQLNLQVDPPHNITEAVLMPESTPAFLPMPATHVDRAAAPALHAPVNPPPAMHVPPHVDHDAPPSPPSAPSTPSIENNQYVDSSYLSSDATDSLMHVKCIHELCTIILVFHSYLHHIRCILLLFNDLW